MRRFFFVAKKGCTKVVFSFKKKKDSKQNQPPQDMNRTDYTQERKGKIVHESKRLPSVYRTERTDAKRGKHQTVTFKSHQRSIFHGIFSRQFYS